MSRVARRHVAAAIDKPGAHPWMGGDQRVGPRRGHDAQCGGQAVGQRGIGRGYRDRRVVVGAVSAARIQQVVHARVGAEDRAVAAGRGQRRPLAAVVAQRLVEQGALGVARVADGGAPGL